MKPSNNVPIKDVMFGSHWDIRENALHNSARDGFEALSKDIHDNAVKHGFWKYRDTREMATKIALAHSELSEALEALRHSYPKSDKIPYGNFEEELADCVIRILDMAYVHKVDLFGAILAKHSYNKNRPYKHGGKKC